MSEENNKSGQQCHWCEDDLGPHGGNTSSNGVGPFCEECWNDLREAITGEEEVRGEANRFESRAAGRHSHPELDTKFWIGDVVYAVTVKGMHVTEVSGPLTVGKVEVIYIDSQGAPESAGMVGDNYKPQKSRREMYMCNETGIGSGISYDVDRVFKTKEEAEACVRGVQLGIEYTSR